MRQKYNPTRRRAAVFAVHAGAADEPNSLPGAFRVVPGAAVGQPLLIFRGPIGRLPPVTLPVLLIGGALTGRAQSTELQQIFVDVISMNNTGYSQAPLRPPKSITARAGNVFCCVCVMCVGGSPPLRHPDPNHLLRKRKLKNMSILLFQFKFASSIRERDTCKPASILAHLRGVELVLLQQPHARHPSLILEGLLSRYRLARGAFASCCRSFVFVSLAW